MPLAEAWDSGAKRWNDDTRTRYANDLHDPRTLVAVTASSNRSKSDQDPAEWMPQFGHCKYVRQWVAVKMRWRLTVDRTEKRALRPAGERLQQRPHHGAPRRGPDRFDDRIDRRRRFHWRR